MKVKRMLFKKLLKNKFIQLFLVSPVSKRIVYFFDLCIVVLSTLLMLLFYNELSEKTISNLQLISFSIVIAVYALTGLIIGNHKWIVRFSSSDDFLKIFFLVLVSTIVLSAINILYSIF